MSRVEQLTRMLEADPDDAFLLYALAQEHAKESRHGEALVFYDRCLKADGAYCYAYYHKARSQEALGRHEDAKSTLRAGLEAARTARDAHAFAEIEGYLDAIT